MISSLLEKFFASPVIVNYVLNDPSSNMQKKVALLPSPGNLKISVAGFKKDPAPLNSLGGQANNCYVTITNFLHYVQPKFLKLKRWAATSSLKIYPRAGQDLNAYYDRRNLKFFYLKNPKGSNTIFTCNSSDIVAHELGHAYLDAIRPDFWSVQALEIWAFHEAFADITAVVTAMQFDEIINRAIAETGGDLRKPNMLSRLAEEVGIALHHLTHGATMPDALRNAVNLFKYTSPEKLPAEAPDNKLANECHSFGRVFLGTWYDILVGIYEKERHKNVPAKAALIIARDVAYGYLLKAVKRTPRVPRYHEALSTIMLRIDAEAGMLYQDVLKVAFLNRGIKQSITMLSTDMHKNDLEGAQEVIKFNKAVLVPQKKMVRLSEIRAKKNIVGILSVEGQDITNIEVEVAADKFYMLDNQNKVVGAIAPSDEEILDAAHNTVSNIKELGFNAMWDVKDNKLVRKFIV